MDYKLSLVDTFPEFRDVLGPAVKGNPELDRRKKIFREAFSTPEGQAALREIMLKSGFSQSQSVPLNSVNSDYIMVYHKAMRELYLWIRSHLEPQTIIKVEHDGA